MLGVCGMSPFVLMVRESTHNVSDSENAKKKIKGWGVVYWEMSGLLTLNAKQEPHLDVRPYLINSHLIWLLKYIYFLRYYSNMEDTWNPYLYF